MLEKYKQTILNRFSYELMLDCICFEPICAEKGVFENSWIY